MLPVLIRPGASMRQRCRCAGDGLYPEQKRQIVAQFRQNWLLRLAPGDDAEVVFNALPGLVFHGS